MFEDSFKIQQKMQKNAELRFKKILFYDILYFIAKNIDLTL